MNEKLTSAARWRRIRINNKTPSLLVYSKHTRNTASIVVWHITHGLTNGISEYVIFFLPSKRRKRMVCVDSKHMIYQCNTYRKVIAFLLETRRWKNKKRRICSRCNRKTNGKGEFNFVFLFRILFTLKNIIASALDDERRIQIVNE